MPDSLQATRLAQDLDSYLAKEVERLGSTTAIDPGHRHAFHWPPHPISYGFQIRAHDWTEHAAFEDAGERFEVEVARNEFGVFGRSVELWHEARGTDLDDMLAKLRIGAQPILKRQRAIAECLGLEKRFTGSIRGMEPFDHLRLLLCSDRDVAHEAHLDIEMQAATQGIFGPSLVRILQERRHPYRRSAQWATLDLFEDLDRVCPRPEERSGAVEAMRGLLWSAEDDFCRTTFKAGVVLGGHMPGEIGGPVLLECLEAPSKFGRRSAIHGLFHVVEWDPSQQAVVVAALQRHAKIEPEPSLAEFARLMSEDIGRGIDHHTEPRFSEES